MATFFDLSEAVRKRISRQHLLFADDSSWSQHLKVSVMTSTRPVNRIEPAILAVDARIYAEAAPIYYGENTFRFADTYDLSVFLAQTERRSAKMVRKIVFAFDVKFSFSRPEHTGNWNGASETFKFFDKFKGLEELEIMVDERRLVTHQCRNLPYLRRWWPGKEIPRQLNLKVLTTCSMDTLRKMRGIPKVTFVGGEKLNNRPWDGPIPGGILETVVAQEMMSPSCGRIPRKVIGTSFPFHKLPAELRNRVYKLLLTFPGGIVPINGNPTSALTSKWGSGSVKNERKPAPKSTLSLLLANRQIHDEALGIFYHCNKFEFVFPLHLQQFLLSLGDQRRNSIREITIWYKNHIEGCFESMDVTFSLLSRLRSLKSLHIVFEDFRGDRPHNNLYQDPTVKEIHGLPGIATLKKIKDLEELTIRCLLAEQGYRFLSREDTAHYQRLVQDFTESLKRDMYIGKYAERTQPKLRLKKRDEPTKPRGENSTKPQVEKPSRWEKELKDLTGSDG